MKRSENKATFDVATKLMTEVRELIVKRMKKLGYTQEALSLRMGKTRSNVAVLLTQKNIMSIPIIIDFCIALDMDFQLLFKERDASVSIKVG